MNPACKWSARAVVLALLLGAGMLLASCVTVPTGAAAGAAGTVPAEGPAKWQVVAGFASMGLTLTSSPAANVSGPVEIVLTASTDVQVLAMVQEMVAGATARTMTARRSGSEHHVMLDFPASGVYQVTLFGKPASDASDKYTMLAMTTLKATVDATATVVLYPAAARYGLALKEKPPAQVGGEAAVSFTFETDFSIRYSFYDRVSKNYVGDSIDFSRGKQSLTAVMSFPATGDYELRIDAKPATGPGDYEDLVVVRLHATVDPSAASGAPAGWSVGPGYKRYGVSVTSAPPVNLGDYARIEFTTTKEVSLSYAFRNNTTKKDGSALGSDLIHTDADGTRNVVEVFFPEDGEYDLWLYARTKEEEDSIKIGRLSFTAKVPDRSGKLPVNWSVHPRFWAFGLGVTSAPFSREVGESLSLVVTVPPGCEVTPLIKSKTTGSYLRTVRHDEKAGELRITALFPKSGEYELSLSGKVASDKYSWTVGRAAFVATVDDSVLHYRSWQGDAGWPEVPLLKVQAVEAPWKPLGRWSEEERRQKAVLGSDFTFPAGEAAVTLKKGTVLEFSMLQDQGLLGQVVFPLPKDFTRKVEEVPVTFKAGTPFGLSSDGMAGVLAREVRIPIHGTEIAVPKGSRLVVDYTLLSEIELAGRSTVTFAGTRYECTGTVIVQTNCFEMESSTVSIVTAKAVPLQFGQTRFTLPAGSVIAFRKDGIDHVTVAQDLEVVVNGAADTIPAGWQARFNAQGAMEKQKAE